LGKKPLKKVCKGISFCLFKNSYFFKFQMENAVCELKKLIFKILILPHWIQIIK